MNHQKDLSGFYQNINYIHEFIGDEKRKFTKIPVELCFYVIKNKMIPQFKVYILLKMISSGKIKLSKYKKYMLSEFCGYKTIRSFNNQLNRLRALNWIGYNRVSKVYHIRSYQYLQKVLQLKSRTGFWFDIRDMQDFDAVIYGAVIGYLSKVQWKRRGIDLQKGRSYQVPPSFSTGFYPIANNALAKILNISKSTASKMKRRAEEEECIIIKRKRIKVPATHDDYKTLKRLYPEEVLHPIIWKGSLYQRFPDFVKPNLKYGRRKKIDK